MDRRIDISVIIPVYNAGTTVVRAVHSILVQEYEPVEIIIVDDGSTDDSPLLCDDLASLDERVRVIHKENGGVSSARNAGLDAASGEYVMFLDADDAVRYGALASMYRSGWDLIAGGFAKVSGQSVLESYKPAGEEEFRNANEICRFLDTVIAKKHSYLLNSACFKLFRLSLIREQGLRFDEILRYGEDKMFVFSYLSCAEKIRTVPEIVYDYILQPGSLSADLTSDSHLDQIFRLLERYKPVLAALGERYAASGRVRELYHTDFVGRYVCRILTVFARRQSDLMTEENITLLYSYMAEDLRLGVFSIRLGQMVNILLYKIGKPSFTMSVYRLTSRRSR